MTENTDSDSTDDVPPPGTDAALDMGCKCPVLDNPYHGIDGFYVYSEDCPLHTPDNDP